MNENQYLMDYNSKYKYKKINKVKKNLTNFLKKIFFYPKEIYLEIFPLEKSHIKVKDYKTLKKIKNKISKNKKKYEIDGYKKYYFYSNSKKLAFRINFYKSIENDYIIEFQRINGDVFLWREHYLSMKKDLLYIYI